MKVKYLVVFSLFVLILFAGIVSANENITEDISQNQDSDILENTVTGNTFADIQTAVNNAKDNDVIELNGNYTSSKSAINVNKNLVFQGSSAGATLDAKGLSGIFTTSLNNYTITLKNINFINAKDSVFMDTDCLNSKGMLVIDNCNFTNNVGTEYGAIACYNCSVTNSIFINNKAKGIYDGSSYVSWAGAIESRNCNLNGCYFENNSAINVAGAIEGNVNAENCVFKHNWAEYRGGAINGNVNIKNSNFIANYVNGYGGAIYGDSNISNCIFNSNSAKYGGGAIEGSCEVINSVFTNNIADYGGAIHSLLGCVDMNNSTFKSNSQGAVIADGISIKDLNKTFMGHQVIDDNLNPINLIKVDVSDLSTLYHSDNDLKIKLTYTTSNKAAPFLGIKVIVKSGKKVISIYGYTNPYVSVNSKGIATFKASKLPAGKYSVTIEEGYPDNEEGFFICPIPTSTVNIVVSKANTIVKAPKVTNKYKKTKYFKVTVKDKVNKKVIKSLKLKLKVYTGKKFKTYTITTNKKGVAKFNTKKLSRGKHKVVITSSDKSYMLQVKSKIKIK